MPLYYFPLFELLLLEIFGVTAHFALDHLAEALDLELLHVEVRCDVIQFVIVLDLNVEFGQLLSIDVSGRLDLLAGSQTSLIAPTLAEYVDYTADNADGLYPLAAISDQHALRRLPTVDRMYHGEQRAPVVSGPVVRTGHAVQKLLLRLHHLVRRFFNCMDDFILLSGLRYRFVDELDPGGQINFLSWQACLEELLAAVLNRSAGRDTSELQIPLGLGSVASLLCLVDSPLRRQVVLLLGPVQDP